MNTKEVTPHGTAAASEHTQTTPFAPRISPQPACTRCSGGDENDVIPRPDAGRPSSDQPVPDPLLQFLVVQIEQLAKRLDETASALLAAQTHDEANGESTCAGSVADDESEDKLRWQALEADMKKRQEGEESLREGLEHLRVMIGQSLQPPVGHSATDLDPCAMELLRDWPNDVTTKPKPTKKSMSDLREALRLATKICVIISLIVGIVALSRLPGQVDGLSRLVGQKRNDRGLGIYVRW